MSNPDQFSKILQHVTEVFEEKIVFNQVLGVRVKTLDIENGQGSLEFDMMPSLVGNFMHQILHGGVISAVLDAVGGMTAYLGVLKKMQHQSFEEQISCFAKLGTIDLRIDFLRPGQGKSFLGTSSIMRAGNKVAVTRMEFYNEQNTLIAVGTGTYMVG